MTFSFKPFKFKVIVFNKYNNSLNNCFHSEKCSELSYSKKLMRTPEFQVRNYCQKSDCMQITIIIPGYGKQKYCHSHKYYSALAHKRKGLRLKWEDENIVKLLATRFNYELIIHLLQT